MAKLKTYVTTVARAKAATGPKRAVAANASAAKKRAAREAPSVPCPTCAAGQNQPCKLASGKRRTDPYRERQWTAADNALVREVKSDTYNPTFYQPAHLTCASFVPPSSHAAMQ
jgi:hypothetical protein